MKKNDINEFISEEKIQKFIKNFMKDYLNEAEGEIPREHTPPSQIRSNPNKKISASVPKNSKLPPQLHSQTGQPPKNSKFDRNKERMANKKTDPNLFKIQSYILQLKNRLGSLNWEGSIKLFLELMKDFDIHVNSNSENYDEINSYLSPVYGQLQAIQGILNSIESEFEKLDEKIKPYINESINNEYQLLEGKLRKYIRKEIINEIIDIQVERKKFEKNLNKVIGD